MTLPAVEKPRPFTCLPRERYVAERWFEREMEEVVSRQWLYFCHESQLPNVGDVLARDLCDESIVASRAGDGAIHAFFNVCRHRGSRICDTGSATVKKFVCPYHRWTYELDGRLRNAPSMRDGEDFDFAEYGLRRVHVDSWRGFVFVAIGEEPPARSLAAMFADGDPQVDVFAPEQLKRAHQAQYEVACNWKLLVENFKECYHCHAAHPELCVVYDVSGREDVGTHAEVFTSEESQCSPWPLRPGVESFTISGKVACKRLLGSAEPSTPAYGVGIKPTLTTILFVPDYAVVHQLLPVSAERSRWTTEWLVHAEAVEGSDYDVGELTEIWKVTNLQDIELCERTQLGVRSRSFTPGPNSPTREPGIRGTLAAYHRLLGESDRFRELTGEFL